MYFAVFILVYSENYFYFVVKYIIRALCVIKMHFAIKIAKDIEMSSNRNNELDLIELKFCSRIHNLHSKRLNRFAKYDH